jgi:hypothetical protein
MRANYTEIEQKLRDLEPFRGSSVTAYWDGDVYKVKSYSTTIATAVQRGYWTTFDGTYYSNTTSRIQNIIKRTGEVI